MDYIIQKISKKHNEINENILHKIIKITYRNSQSKGANL